MRHLNRFFLAFLGILISNISFAKQVVNEHIDNVVRQKFTTNQLWQFSKGANPSGWESINLPHTWNTSDVLDDSVGYYKGVGWYKKTLSLPISLKGSKIYLFFEGAYNTTELFINNKSVGKHIGGYSAFSFDITKFVSFGEKFSIDTLLVKVDNSVDYTTAPISGDFTFFGGIYRDVFVIATNEVHFDMANYSSDGVFVKTSEVSANSAKIKLWGKIVNESANKLTYKIVSDIISPDGKIVKSTSTSGKVKSTESFDFAQDAIILDKPLLWSPETPNLYTINIRIEDALTGKILDSKRIPLGVRWFSFDANKGFFLNGEHYKLTGTCRHQDYKGIGNALPDQLHIRDLKIIKEMGSNFIRISHYPQDPSLIEACDKLGLIAWMEIPIVNEIDTSAAFAFNVKENTKEMVRQNYNHPSIMMWGYMNEVFATNKMKKINRNTLLQKTTTLAKEINQLIKAEDPDRYTVMALEFSFKDEYFDYGIAQVPDVVGWNLYFGWYTQESYDDLGEFLDEWHKKLPDKAFIMSEYGAGSDIRFHALKTVKYDNSMEYQSELIESSLRQILERPYVAASSVWNSFDFSSEGRNDFNIGINIKGVCTFDRKPKEVYYYYQSKLTNQPVLKIASFNWKSRAGRPANTSDKFCVQPVKIYSNLSQVEMFQNGKSIGIKSITDCKAVWDVAFVDGQNILQVKAVTPDGKEFADNLAINFRLDPYLLNDLSFKEIAVHFGSNGFFVEDPSGIVFEPDQAYEKGSWGYVADKDSTSNNYKKMTSSQRYIVKNTINAPLYYIRRFAINEARFDVADGEYEVELYLVEGHNNSIFDILINGTPYYHYPQIIGTVKVASNLKTIISVSKGNGISITYKKEKGEPFISAVRISKRN